MKDIEEQVKVLARYDKIYNFWVDKYRQMGLDVGSTSHVTDTKRGVKFKILELKKNESITIAWYSHFIKFVYFHHVKPLEKGSLVTCRVSIKGFFAFLIKPFISNKIKKYLQISLKKFSSDIGSV